MATKGWQPPFNRDRHEQSGQFRMWRAMRIHKRFKHADIETSAPGGTRATVRSYVVALTKAGFLRREGKHSDPVYVVVRNPGPLAPQIRRDGLVYDLNRDKAYGPDGKEVHRG
jgi:hypothetical protein